jgi:hypothetical protein
LGNRQETPFSSKIPQLQSVADAQLTEPRSWDAQDRIRRIRLHGLVAGQPDARGIQRSPIRVTPGAPVRYGRAARHCQDSEFRTSQVGLDAAWQLQLLRRAPDVIGHPSPGFQVIMCAIYASAIHPAFD